MKFQVKKRIDGFSTCFRQWRADGTHCRFLHGYGVYFEVHFEGEMDQRNWVYDFGGFKRATSTIDGMTPSEYFKWLLDHTVIIAEDDPFIKEFIDLRDKGVIQLRILPNVGCERFAEFLLNKINTFLDQETSGRVKAVKLEVFEHEKNSATAYLK